MPQALPFIALAVTAAGTGVAVHASIEQAKAAEKAADFNEKVAENNAKAAQFQAQAEAEQIRRRNLAIAGRQRALFAKSGVLISGSAEDIMYDSAVQGELDRMTAIYSGSAQSTYYQSQGRLAAMEGRARSNAAYLSAAGYALSGAGNAGSSYARITED